MYLIPVMVKLKFQQQLRQFFMSHDPSEIIVICWIAEKLILIISVKCWNVAT